MPSDLGFIGLLDLITMPSVHWNPWLHGKLLVFLLYIHSLGRFILGEKKPNIRDLKTTTSTHLDIASTQFIRSIIGKIYLCNFPGFLHFLYCKVQHKPNRQRTWSVYIIEEPTVICCDNMSIIAMTKNPIFHARTKHIELRHHFIRDLVSEGEIQLEFISTNDQPADVLTKAVTFDKIEWFKKHLKITN